MRKRGWKKGQAWYLDVVFGIIIFSIGVSAYLLLSTNLLGREESNQRDAAYEIDSLSSQLVSEGYPRDWNATTAVRIGLTDGNYRLDARKWEQMNAMSYADLRGLLGTRFDFAAYIEGNFSNATAINGICAIGDSRISTQQCGKLSFSMMGDDIIRRERYVFYEGEIRKMVVVVVT